MMNLKENFDLLQNKHYVVFKIKIITKCVILLNPISGEYPDTKKVDNEVYHQITFITVLYEDVRIVKEILVI